MPILSPSSSKSDPSPLLFTRLLDTSDNAAINLKQTCKDNFESENYAEFEPAPKDLNNVYLKSIYFVLNLDGIWAP